MDGFDFDKGIFQACRKLSYVYYYAVEMPRFYVYDGSLEGFDAENATLHVPAYMVDEFKEDSEWGKFGNIVPLTEEEKGIFSVNG